MAGTAVTVLGSSYVVPVNGQSPSWGDDLHDVVVALADYSNSASGPSDIPLTSFTVANNQSSVSNITGLAFDIAAVQSAIITYSVYRVTSGSELCENGQISIQYKQTAATWNLSQTCSGTSGITFTITSGGQVQYVSTSMSGTGYVGKLKFSARAFLQA